MENLIFLLTASLVMYQSSKKSTKVVIGDTGATLNFPGIFYFDNIATPEGDSLYFAEHLDNKVTYGVVCARLHSRLPLDEAQVVMNAYLTGLQKPFGALYNTGADACNEGNIQTRCAAAVDYWQDAHGTDWKVKCYTNGRVIAVLYVNNIAELPVEKQDEFLDSFRF